MSNNQRRASAFLAVALAALVATPLQATEPQNGYLPRDAEIVVTVNVRQILDSELVKGKKEALDQIKALVEGYLQGDEHGQKYMRALGFDVFRDLESITTAAPGGVDQTKVLVILEGKFDTKKFHDTAREAAGEHGDVLKVSRSGTYQICEISPPGKDKTIYVSLVNSGVLLVSQGKTTLSDALDRQAAGKKTRLKKGVVDLLDTCDAKQSVSFLATSAALAKMAEDSNSPQAALAGPLLQMIEGINGGVTLGNDVQFQLGINTKNAETAQQFTQQVNIGLIAARGMVAKKAKEDEKLSPLVDVVKTLRASTQNNTVLIRGQIPAPILEQLIADAMKRRKE